MPKVKDYLILKITLVGLFLFALAIPNLLESHSLQSAIVSQLNQKQVENIAKSVTVRIMSGSEAGSGVIVEHRRQIYTVLTNRHVVANNPDNSYTVLTEDGQIHEAKWLLLTQFTDLDLAVIQFQSLQYYQVAEIGNSHRLLLGETVYAAGFPNWQWLNDKEIKSTHSWGRKALSLTIGKVAMLPQKSLKDGYQLGYTNKILEGMSGGSVFNRFGKLVGINGRMKYPLSGIEGFRFADGTLPKQVVFEKMEALNWAIPISRVKLS